jgi:hypothetical protein
MGWALASELEGLEWVGADLWGRSGQSESVGRSWRGGWKLLKVAVLLQMWGECRSFLGDDLLLDAVLLQVEADCCSCVGDRMLWLRLWRGGGEV